MFRKKWALACSSTNLKYRNPSRKTLIANKLPTATHAWCVYTPSLSTSWHPPCSGAGTNHNWDTLPIFDVITTFLLTMIQRYNDTALYNVSFCFQLSTIQRYSSWQLLLLLSTFQPLALQHFCSCSTFALDFCFSSLPFQHRVLSPFDFAPLSPFSFRKAALSQPNKPGEMGVTSIHVNGGGSYQPALVNQGSSNRTAPKRGRLLYSWPDNFSEHHRVSRDQKR